MVVVLHNIRSVHNVGSIFRTADAAGVEKIYLCGITPAPIDKYGRARQDFIKVSLGAEKYVAWEKKFSTARTLNDLKKEGYKILAVEQDKKSIPYYKFRDGHAFLEESKRLDKKIVLVFGNEVNGSPQSVLKMADKILEIPMKGKKESLNVSVAFGIVVFHINTL